LAAGFLAAGFVAMFVSPIVFPSVGMGFLLLKRSSLVLW